MNNVIEELSKEGLLLKQIPKKMQTIEVCKVAIKQNPNALQYASKKCLDSELCFEAVKSNINSFRYIPDSFKTKEMCLFVVKADANLIDKVPINLRSREICMIAIENKLETLRYATKEVICEMLNRDGLLLREIPKAEQTKEICDIAIKQNHNALQYASQKCIDNKLCLEAVEKDVSMLRYVPKKLKTNEMCWLAVGVNPELLSKVPDELKTKEMCLASVKKEPSTFKYTPLEIRGEIINEEISKELLNRLVDINVEWLKYMPYCKSGIDISLEAIKEDFAVCEYLTEEIKRSKEILFYQKSLGKVRIYRKLYDFEERVFKVEVKVIYDIETYIINREEYVEEESYEVAASFKNFNEFYDFLDGDLYEAELRDYKFERVELKNYNINGAIIHQQVLDRYGLYDSSYFEGIKKRIQKVTSDEVDKNEICIHKGFSYAKPVEEYGHSLSDYTKTPIFYISDIHLAHKVKNKFKKEATKEEVEWYVKILAKKLIESIGTIPFDSYLLIAGDTSSEFELLKIFYEKLICYWKPRNIIVIHGNHELWDPYVEMESNIEFYRKYFKEKGIIFLQNDLLLIRNRYEKLILKEEEILDLSVEELRNLSQECSIIVLGGIGFSGLNSKYNAKSMKYGKSFEEEALKKDKFETNRFNSIYRKLLHAIPFNKVMVLSHMQKWDWNEEEHNSNWIYINGHSHRNYFDISSKKVVYADNQIGYNGENIGLKYFYIDNEYDIFAYLEDGIHEITKNQYIDFNKGKLIQMSFKRDEGQIYLIKKNEKYLFMIYCHYSKKSKNKFLYILNGGKPVKLVRNRIEDLNYYYDCIDNYVENIDKLLEKYTGNQNKISKFIKELGGSGDIHGCIVDIDRPSLFGSYSYCHIFVNPTDGTVTPYFANDIKSRIVYKDLKTLLKSQRSCKILNDNYKKIEMEMNNNIPIIKYSSELVEWGEKDRIDDEGTYLYKISRIIRSLQYTSEKGVIRVWNEELLNKEFINSLESTNKIEDMISENLIIEID